MISILAGLVSALPTFAPVIIPVVLYFWNMFAKNEAQKEANRKAFLDAIAAHQNDAVASANERANAWEQLKELRERAAKRDAEAAQAEQNKSK